MELLEFDSLEAELVDDDSSVVTVLYTTRPLASEDVDVYVDTPPSEDVEVTPPLEVVVPAAEDEELEVVFVLSAKVEVLAVFKLDDSDELLAAAPALSDPLDSPKPVKTVYALVPPHMTDPYPLHLTLHSDELTSSVVG